MINITCSSISSAFATQVRIIILKIISFLIYQMSQNIKRIVPTTSASYNRLCSPYIFPLFNLSSSLFSYLSTPHHIVLNTLLLLLGLLPSLRGPSVPRPSCVAYIPQQQLQQQKHHGRISFFLLLLSHRHKNLLIRLPFFAFV